MVDETDCVHTALPDLCELHTNLKWQRPGTVPWGGGLSNWTDKLKTRKLSHISQTHGEVSRFLFRINTHTDTQTHSQLPAVPKAIVLKSFNFFNIFLLRYN